MWSYLRPDQLYQQYQPELNAMCYYSTGWLQKALDELDAIRDRDPGDENDEQG